MLSRVLVGTAIIPLVVCGCVLNNQGAISVLSESQTTATGASNPIIQAIAPNPSAVAGKHDTITFTVVCYAPDGSPLDYTWTSTKGLLSATKGQVVSWTPAKADGTVESGIAAIQVIVTNGKGGIAQAAINVTIASDGGAVTGKAEVSPPPTVSKPGQASQQPGLQFTPIKTFTSRAVYSYLSSNELKVSDQGYSEGASQNYIYSTSDGGARWKQHVVPFKGTIRSMHWLNGNSGWLGGDLGQLAYVTVRDDTVEYKPLASGIIKRIDSLYFDDAENGYFLSGGEVYRTSNGGASWDKPISLVKLDAERVDGWKVNRFFKDGANNTFLRLNDNTIGGTARLFKLSGGLFSPVLLNGSPNILDCSFGQSKAFVRTAHHNEVFHSAQEWSTVEKIGPAFATPNQIIDSISISELVAISDNDLIGVMSRSGIILSSDSGKKWTNPSNEDTKFKTMHPIENNRVWATGWTLGDNGERETLYRADR